MAGSGRGLRACEAIWARHCAAPRFAWSIRRAASSGGASSIALLTVGAAIAWIAAFIILSVLGTLVSGLLAALLTGVGQV